jgi:hypothetical protein
LMPTDHPTQDDTNELLAIHKFRLTMKALQEAAAAMVTTMNRFQLMAQNVHEALHAIDAIISDDDKAKTANHRIMSVTPRDNDLMIEVAGNDEKALELAQFAAFQYGWVPAHYEMFNFGVDMWRVKFTVRQVNK